MTSLSRTRVPLRVLACALLALLLRPAASEPAVDAVASIDAMTSFLGADLPKLSLNKVLLEGSEVFGICGADTPTSRWMAWYPDRTPIVNMNIPGTHDSMTWNYTAETAARLAPVTNLHGVTVYPWQVYRTQSRSLCDSLNAGIRFFDLRYAADITGTRLVLFHAQALVSEISTLDDVMYGFYAWLETHRTETVIVSLMYEGSTIRGASNNANIQLQLHTILSSPAAKKYILQTRDELGTLGPTRGKIILFKRFTLDKLPADYDASLPGLHMDPARWADNNPDFSITYNTATNATAYIEDLYEPNTPVTANATVNIGAKLNATLAHLAKAARPEYAGSLFVTYSSGERNYAVAAVVPQIMALGNGTEYTPQAGVNQQLLTYLQGVKGKVRLGIVAVDFWDEPAGLVAAILGR
ncbi:PLC-like phosphodiesterase [Gonapodya prolifera JEL478]|uniref:PLC-like phosphodiesterase n=1 Tax=Gonapodya prolifera (strain JEL478) TaxID=1344416 RepID=A0A139AB06_GONPJ|nr:PLC-like phosphodiesterase [Gonapodya prolifera JEL478]|eukprot:KXS14011.1 PLC-like phosphodiesterase [Gonapodya prolifera JEL478]